MAALKREIGALDNNEEEEEETDVLSAAAEDDDDDHKKHQELGDNPGGVIGGAYVGKLSDCLIIFVTLSPLSRIPKPLNTLNTPQLLSEN